MPGLISRCGGGGFVGWETVVGAPKPPGRAPNLLGTCDWTHLNGDVLMDYVGTTRPFVINAGTYSFAARMAVHGFTLSAGVIWRTNLVIANLQPYEVDLDTDSSADGTTAAWAVTVTSAPMTLAAGDQVLPQFLHGQPATSLEADGLLMVARLA